MTTNAAPDREGLVLQPEDGASYWQPVPANGYVTVKLTPEQWDGPFSMGFQVVAPRSHVRQHAHDRHQEVLFVWGGRGRAIVDGVEHPMQPGTVILARRDVQHTFINDGDEELKLLWMLTPHGLEEFFAAIGRPRIPGEPAPPSFPRPADVAEIEARTVFAPPRAE
ncbi:cupin domain-containing protein [Arenibaculum sp.]|jgi:quercetin dioxygenase-like cupin family protein|uniref:cupin domain-containing protein n=1 Tax=Arenibaculum sp. TaxID=2865862 RepID=UPI002E10FF6A|nr:cupin domain-containing protein [Arenibaculum sp.]